VKNVAKTEPTLSDTHPIVYGYCRCSTNEDKQDIRRQERDLSSAGVEKYFYEYEHGDSICKKQQELLFDTVKRGDTVVVTEVSRLARSTTQLCNIIEKIQEKHICLIILNSMTIDCRNDAPDPMTLAFLQIAAVFSELELKMIRSRVKSGMANAKAKGAPIGRPKVTQETIPDIFFRYYPQYVSGVLNISALARVTKIARSTCYRYLAVLESK
jgi:DNA invertase Pin-like site-specific DNA recombinase